MLCGSLVALLVGAGGCNYAAFLGALLPEPTKKIKPEFAGLPNKTLAIFVYAGQGIQYDYRIAQIEVAQMIGAQMTKNIKGLRVIDQLRVQRFQEQDINWDSRFPGALCRPFNADYVMMISLEDFSTREPGMIHLLRGRITAQLSLYKSASEDTQDRAPAYRVDNIAVIYPPNSPEGIPTDDEYGLRLGTERTFADIVAKKFYEYEIKDDQ
jgi:hypothetical protein